MEMLPELLWKMSWQTAIVAAVVWIITRLARTAPAAWRHALWLVVLIKFFIPPFAYLPSQLAIDKTPAPSTYARVVTADPPVVHSESKTSPDADGSSHQPVVRSTAAELAMIAYWNMGILTGWAWTAAVSICTIVLLVRYRRQKRLVAFGHADDQYDGLLRECADTMGIRRLPRIRLSDRVATPMLAGLRRPTILLPTEITESCTPSDLKAILMHELAHVKRRDMAVIWLQQLAQILFFFHPAVWIAGHQLKREREIASDEMVLSKAGIPHKDYASGYVAALRLANDTPRSAVSLAMAEPFEVERRRVQLMLRAVMPRFTLRWAVALALMVLVGVPTFVGYGASEEALAVKTKVTGDGFTLEYKNPPTWKWKDLTFTVKSIGRSKYLDRDAEQEKGFTVCTELRRPSGRWNIMWPMDITFGLAKADDGLSSAESHAEKAVVYKLDTPLPARGTREFDLHVTVYEGTPTGVLNGGPYPLPKVTRLLSLHDKGLYLTTSDWRIGGLHTSYVQGYTDHPTSAREQLGPFPGKMRSAPTDTRYLALRVFYARTHEPDHASPEDFVVYDSAGRSLKMEEIRHCTSLYTWPGGNWHSSTEPYLGMMVARTAGSEMDESGKLSHLLVIAVDPVGPAETAGLKVGDTVVECEGIEWSADGVGFEVSTKPRRLVILRDRRKLTLTLRPILDPLWSEQSSDASRALRDMNGLSKRFDSPEYYDSLLYTDEPVPADFAPAKLGFKISFGGRTIREVKFRIKDIPIPGEFWEQMDKQKPYPLPWKRGG